MDKRIPSKNRRYRETIKHCHRAVDITLKKINEDTRDMDKSSQEYADQLQCSFTLQGWKISFDNLLEGIEDDG